MHRRYLDRLGTLGRAHYPAAQHWNREVKQNFAQAGIGLAHLDHLRLVYGVKEKKGGGGEEGGVRLRGYEVWVYRRAWKGGRNRINQVRTLARTLMYLHIYK